MVAFQHPAGLNPLQRFRQAGSVLRGTSRASNAAWYLSALDLDFQIHLKVDGTRFVSRLFDRKSGQWSEGPTIDDSLATDLSSVPGLADQLIAAATKAGANAIGVVLHVADEFATSELKPELDNPGALTELRATIDSDPKNVLDDSSVSATDSSWRLIPYPAAGSEAIATTVCLSRGWALFLGELRKVGEERNFPIVTRAVSAPLICLLGLPFIKTDALNRPIIVVLPYPRFTLLAFFNEHGDLRLLRTLQHRGQRRPTNLRHAASTTAAALELSDPEVFLLATGDLLDPQMAADLRLVFPASAIHEIDWAGTSFLSPVTPADGPEARIVTSLNQLAGTPLGSAHTFTVLATEGWATQDFMPMAKESAEIYPTRGEMKLLRSAKYAILGFASITVLALAWTLLGVIDMIRKPEWSFDSKQAQSQQQRLAFLTSERNRSDHSDNLLEDRSKAWASMELLSTLFPAKSGFLVKTFTHSVKMDSAPGQAKVGFSKEWKITGLAREEALEQLAILNTRDGISATFDKVAKNTGNQAYATDLPSRNLVVNVRTLENSSYRPGPLDESSLLDDASYPFSFDLVVTQRFETSDQMAVLAAKAPDSKGAKK